MFDVPQLMNIVTIQSHDFRQGDAAQMNNDLTRYLRKEALNIQVTGLVDVATPICMDDIPLPFPTF